MAAVDAPWQVIQEPDGLRVQVSSQVVDINALGAALARAVKAAGAVDTQVRLQRVTSIRRTALGKAPLIRALPT